MDEQIHSCYLVEKWANDEFYQDFSESHGAVLRNFARWFMKRDRAILEAAAERVCIACKKSLAACHESCVGEKECFINLAILEPITKEKS